MRKRKTPDMPARNKAKTKTINTYTIGWFSRCGKSKFAKDARITQPQKGEQARKKKHRDPHRIKEQTIKPARYLSRIDQKKKPKMPTMYKCYCVL